VRSLPSFSPDPDDASRGLFTAETPGSRARRGWSQAAQVVTGSREGGFFIMIGQRPPTAGEEPQSHAGHQLESVTA